jgi:hypothetical protein
VSEPAPGENIQGELFLSDLQEFGKYLDLGQFDAKNTGVLVDTCRAWLVFQHATARRWMREFRVLWPPMHDQLDKLRKDLQQQNKQVDALCSGPYAFLAVTGIVDPDEEEPQLFAQYCRDVSRLFNILVHYASFAKVYDLAYAEGTFDKVDYNISDLDRFRDELSAGLRSLAVTLGLMAEQLLPEPPRGR